MRLTCDNDLYFSPFYGTRLLFLLRRLLHFKKQQRSANSYSYTSICTPPQTPKHPPRLPSVPSVWLHKSQNRIRLYELCDAASSNRLPFWSSAVCRRFCRSTPPLDPKNQRLNLPLPSPLPRYPIQPKPTQSKPLQLGQLTLTTLEVAIAG